MIPNETIWGDISKNILKELTLNNITIKFVYAKKDEIHPFYQTET